MSKVKSRQVQAEQARERTVALSAEERAVVERLKKEDGRKREGALWRFGKNPPLFWYLCW